MRLGAPLSHSSPFFFSFCDTDIRSSMKNNTALLSPLLPGLIRFFLLLSAQERKSLESPVEETRDRKINTFRILLDFPPRQERSFRSLPESRKVPFFLLFFFHFCRIAWITESSLIHLSVEMSRHFEEQLRAPK